jgi:penicillin-binding protein 2
MGYVKNIINSTGKCLSQKKFCDAKAGTDVILTLDFELQKIVEALFDKDQSGVFILMDVATGAVRVLLSYPNFDPNLFLQPISEQEWQEKMVPNNPLLNRATCALYPPASTFKLVTLAAALEEKLIDARSEYFCRGYVEFGGRKYACMNHEGHGWITPKQALVKSCNAYLYEVAKRLHVDRLAMYANRFGLGKRTSFMLPEQTGIVPTMAWKRATHGERIWKGEMLSISIGQSFLLATPLQIACMLAAICSGNSVKPRILESEPIEKVPLQFNARTVRFLRDAIKEAVISGTARLLGLIPEVDVFAKTGTAQTCSLDKEVVSKKQLEHGWVTGFFSMRSGGPWYAFAIFVEHVGSSRPALQIADKFLRAYVQLYKQKPEYFNDTSLKLRN